MMYQYYLPIVLVMTTDYNCNQIAKYRHSGKSPGMQRTTQGQSLVEMALLLPLLLIILFAIIDFGYYIYGFATVYQSARNGAEVAATAPPYPIMVPPDSAPNPNDPCVQHVLDAVKEDATLFDGIEDSVRISYPDYVVDPSTGTYLDYEDRRRLGYPIEVEVSYRMEPLTPLWNLAPFIGDETGVITVSTITRRTIGNFGRDPTADNLESCLDLVPQGIPAP
jgi:hypothetical protein